MLFFFTVAGSAAHASPPAHNDHVGAWGDLELCDSHIVLVPPIPLPDRLQRAITSFAVVQQLPDGSPASLTVGYFGEHDFFRSRRAPDRSALAAAADWASRWATR